MFEPHSISLISFLVAIVVGLVGCVETSAPPPESVPATVLGDPTKVGKLVKPLDPDWLSSAVCTFCHTGINN